MPRLAILYSDSTKNQNWGKKTIVQPYVTYYSLIITEVETMAFIGESLFLLFSCVLGLSKKVDLKSFPLSCFCCGT